MIRTQSAPVQVSLYIPTSTLAHKIFMLSALTPDIYYRFVPAFVSAQEAEPLLALLDDGEHTDTVETEQMFVDADTFAARTILNDGSARDVRSALLNETSSLIVETPVLFGGTARFLDTVAAIEARGDMSQLHQGLLSLFSTKHMLWLDKNFVTSQQTVPALISVHFNNERWEQYERHCEEMLYFLSVADTQTSSNVRR